MCCGWGDALRADKDVWFDAPCIYAGCMALVTNIRGQRVQIETLHGASLWVPLQDVKRLGRARHINQFTDGRGGAGA
jgi:hypothetical protein